MCSWRNALRPLGPPPSTARSRKQGSRETSATATWATSSASRAVGRRTGLEEAIAACDAFRSDGQTHAVALILARQISILLSASEQPARARLDADRTAQPKTEIRGIVDAPGECVRSVVYNPDGYVYRGTTPEKAEAKCTCNGSGWVKVGSYESACPATVHTPKPDDRTPKQ